jgi:hypothetical protein
MSEDRQTVTTRRADAGPRDPWGPGPLGLLLGFAHRGGSILRP